MKEIPEPTLRDWDKIQEEIEESYKCPICKGTGKFFNLFTQKEVRCHRCDGTGRLEYKDKED